MQTTQTALHPDLKWLGWFLDSYGMSHQDFEWVGENLNLSATDHHSFFAKIQRPSAANSTHFKTDSSRLRYEIRMSHEAARAGVAAPVPVFNRGLLMPDLRTCTLWERLDMVKTRTTDVILEVVESLVALHQHQPDVSVTPFTLAVPMSRISQRLEGIEHRLVEFLNDQADIAVNTLLTTLNPDDYSWCHGDAHLDNVTVHDGRVTFFDWEMSLVGPREWDYAMLRRDIIEFNRQGYTIDLDVVDAAIDPHVNWTTMHEVMRLRLCSYVAHMLYARGAEQCADYPRIIRLLEDVANSDGPIRG